MLGWVCVGVGGWVCVGVGGCGEDVEDLGPDRGVSKVEWELIMVYLHVPPPLMGPVQSGPWLSQLCIRL